MTTKKYALPPRFIGDGRALLQPHKQDVLAGTIARRVTRAQARRVIQAFAASGKSAHSPAGGTLWVVIEYLRHRQVAISQAVRPVKHFGHTVGWYVKHPKAEGTSAAG